MLVDDRGNGAGWRQHGGSREATGIGVELYPYEGKLPAHAIWFGEDQGRYVVEVAPAKAEEVLERARLLELPARIVGVRPLSPPRPLTTIARPPALARAARPTPNSF